MFMNHMNIDSTIHVFSFLSDPITLLPDTQDKSVTDKLCEKSYAAKPATSPISSVNQSIDSSKSPPPLPAKSKAKSSSPPLPDKKSIGRNSSANSSRSSSRTSSPHPSTANQVSSDLEQNTTPSDKVKSPKDEPPQIPLRRNESIKMAAAATEKDFQLPLRDQTPNQSRLSDYDNNTNGKTGSVFSDRTLVNSTTSDEVYDVANDVLLTPVVPPTNAIGHSQSHTQNHIGSIDLNEPARQTPVSQGEAIYNNQPETSEAVYGNVDEELPNPSATLKGKNEETIFTCKKF